MLKMYNLNQLFFRCPNKWKNWQCMQWRDDVYGRLKCSQDKTEYNEKYMHDL